jgi:hypothetical protein
MTETNETTQPNPERDNRLRVLVSLSWLLLLPLGWFFSYPWLVKLPILRTVTAIAYLGLALYKPLRWSRYFRKRDWITLAFDLLSGYVLAFIVCVLWFWFSPPPNAGDWALDLSLFVLSCLMLCAGLFLALAPHYADELGWYSLKKSHSNPAIKLSSGLRLGRRFSGALLIAVGGIVLSVAIQVAKETWLR